MLFDMDSMVLHLVYALMWFLPATIVLILATNVAVHDDPHLLLL
jgi:hypothetical protein